MSTAKWQNIAGSKKFFRAMVIVVEEQETITTCTVAQEELMEGMEME